MRPGKRMATHVAFVSRHFTLMPGHDSCASPMFKTLVHADWSTTPAKRWAVTATRFDGGWEVHDPRLVPPSDQFVDRLFEATARGPVLAGFDFPIGLPSVYGEQTGLSDFRSALGQFGNGSWDRFYDVAESPTDISLERPFYPRRSSSEARQAHLLTAHRVAMVDDLRRRCERATPDRRAACPLFWTLGGNQVGKAAIAGWQEIVGPALRRGGRLWPFDGTLQDLASAGGLVIAETYPAEAYGHLGIKFGPGESKRRQADRVTKAGTIADWAQRAGVQLDDAMAHIIRDGFGSGPAGEDRFDAALGLFGMIEVVTGRRAPGVPRDPAIARWEGWILGQIS